MSGWRASSDLPQKERGSNNYECQRRALARVYARLTHRKDDFKHELAHYYTTEYDAVFLKELNVKEMLEAPANVRNKAEMGWRDLITVFEHHGKKNECYVETVAPAGTTKMCLVWYGGCEAVVVREHSCPTCGFEADRDHNAALNVLERGLSELGVVHSEVMPEETGAVVSADEAIAKVNASTVVKTGSRALKDARSMRAE